MEYLSPPVAVGVTVSSSEVVLDYPCRDEGVSIIDAFRSFDIHMNDYVLKTMRSHYTNVICLSVVKIAGIPDLHTF